MDARHSPLARASDYAGGIAAFCLTLLPFAAHPFRVEAFESQRASLLGLLAAAALLLGWMHRPRLSRDHKLLLTAALAWALTLLASTALSLSPLHSLAGELTRRMGLLTHLAMIAMLFVGMRLRGDTSQLAMLGGVAVSALVFLERFEVVWPVGGRPPGPFGSATLTGGWLALMITWSTAGLWSCTARRRIGGLLGLGVMGAALLATGSIGATIGAAAGLGTLAVVLVGRNQTARWTARILIVALVVAAAVSGIRASTFTTGPLSWLLESSGFVFRNVMWERVRDLTSTWPVMTGIDTGQDANARVRPLVGYGPEMMEAVFYQRLDTRVSGLVPFQRIDRAHNDWLDTLVTSGWLGVVARAVLWLTIFGVALRRLGFRGGAFWLGVPLVTAFLWGLQAGRFLPLAATGGALAGIWLLLTFLPTTDRRPEPRALIALGVAAAHLIDIQFSFTTVTTGWPFWLALGLLLAPSESAEPDDVLLISGWQWLALAGMWLLRFWLGSGAAPVAVALACGIFAGLARLSGKIRKEQVAASVLLWLFGAFGSQAQTPVLAGAWDIIMISLSAGLLLGKRARMSQVVKQHQFAVAAAAVLLLLWWSDIAADTAMRRALDSSDLNTRASLLISAAERRPWDDMLHQSAGYAIYQAALAAPEAANRTNLFKRADDTLRAAATIHPYKGIYALQLAAIAANQALLVDNPAPFVHAADRYFEAAARLWPLQAEVWREWGRFALEIDHDLQRAKTLLEQALALDEGDVMTRALLARAANTEK